VHNKNCSRYWLPHLTVERVYKMQNTTKGKAAKNATTTTAVVPVAPTLQHTGNELTYACLWAFINGQAGGNLHNVQVVPLSNVKLNDAQPVPFGFNGKAGGVRHQIQTWLLNGVKGNNSLAAILAAAKPLGHSSKKPICLLAMLNGGYSPSSAVWGTGYVKLVVQPQPTK
jgi:hypothetical protein